MEQNNPGQQDNNLNQDTGADNRGNNNASEDSSAVFLGDSSLQTPEEFQQDKQSDHSEDDNKLTSSGIDDLQSNDAGAAGTDRAGTAERKDYGQPSLNQGLEDQQQ